MSKNGKTQLKNLAEFAASDHFRTLCIKGLNLRKVKY